MDEHQRIVFRLERDEDGYPPSDCERLWARPLPNGNFSIDSIPFFVMGISAEDEVSVKIDGDELYFNELVKLSGVSTFRLIPYDQSMIAKVRADIERLGGRSECHVGIGLIAVEIPALSSIHPFLNYLVAEQERGVLDYEESALRHKLED